MKSITIRALAVCLFVLSCAGAQLFAAPKLRLSTTTVGPLDVAPGADGQVQIVEAWNAGDGTLALGVSSPDAWLSPAIGAPQSCSSGPGTCTPIQITLETSSLAEGVRSGTVLIADPSALDAPQTVTVTVRIGGGIPDAISLYAHPGGTDEIHFQTNGRLGAEVSTQSGGDWLSLGIDGSGTFRFVVPYRVSGRPDSSLHEGTYHGSINITASTFAPDVKNVPVTLQVTNEPIGDLSANHLDLELAAGSAAATHYVALRNRGLREIVVESASASDGAEWLAAELVSSHVKITADPGGLEPGLYAGEVTISANSVNAPHMVRVRLRVTAQGPPVARPQGVVNNATFAANDPIPRGGIAAVFGDQLSREAPATGTELPLVRELGGAKVLVNGLEAPLFYSSEGQINFQVPNETLPGEAVVQIFRNGQPGNKVTVQIAEKNPRILTFLGNYAIAVNTDGTFPVPIMPGVDARPARSGDTLVMYAIGFGPTSPGVPSGEPAPADPLAHVIPTPTVLLGGGLLPVQITPAFAGLTPTFAGLYQINFTIPANAPKGDAVPLVIQGPGYQTNEVTLAIQ